MIAIDRPVLHRFSPPQFPGAQVMSVPRKSMTDVKELKPLLIYQQEGRGRAPRLALWNAAESRQYPLPLFPFPNQPASQEPRFEASRTIVDSGFPATERAYISPYLTQGPAPIAENLPYAPSTHEQQSQQESSIQETHPDNGLPSPRRSSSVTPNGEQTRKSVNGDSSLGTMTKAQSLTSTTETLPHGTSVEKHQNERVPSIHETNPNDSLPSPTRSSSTSPNEKGKRKRTEADTTSSPNRATKTQANRSLSLPHNGQQSAIQIRRATPASSSIPTPQKAPSSNPLTSHPTSSTRRHRKPIPINLHEDPTHHDPAEHRLATEAIRLRLSNWPRRNPPVKSTSAVSTQTATPAPRHTSIAIAQEVPTATGSTVGTDTAENISAQNEWGKDKVCHIG